MNEAHRGPLLKVCKEISAMEAKRKKTLLTPSHKKTTFLSAEKINVHKVSTDFVRLL